MPFDRTAITTGRRINDFGLCDLSGVYQYSSKLRARGFLVVAFVKCDDARSVSVVRALQEWTGISDKVTVAAIAIGERADAVRMAADTGVSYPVLWDFEMYVAPLWAVSAVPTLFIVDANGYVLGRVLGDDPQELAAARAMLAETVRKADEAAKAAADAAAASAPPAPPKA